MTIDDRFKQAIQKRNSGNLNSAISDFQSIIKDYSDDPRISGVYIVIAGVYNDLKMYDDAMVNFKKATKLDPQSELASLGLYLSYVELGEDKKAVEELKRYLDEYPADRYKITLQELLADLQDGYALDFKETIVRLAEKNDVRLG